MSQNRGPDSAHDVTGNAGWFLVAGESIRALAEYLGHADPDFTLGVYTHLMPSSEVRAREWPSTESSAEVPRTLRGLRRSQIAETAGQDIDAALLRYLARNSL